MINKKIIPFQHNNHMQKLHSYQVCSNQAMVDAMKVKGSIFILRHCRGMLFLKLSYIVKHSFVDTH